MEAITFEAEEVADADDEEDEGLIMLLCRGIFLSHDAALPIAIEVEEPVEEEEIPDDGIKADALGARAAEASGKDNCDPVLAEAEGAKEADEVTTPDEGAEGEGRASVLADKVAIRDLGVFCK